MAAEIGISAAYLSDIERGNRLPSDAVLTALAKRLNVPIKDMRRWRAMERLPRTLQRLIEAGGEVIRADAHLTAIETNPGDRIIVIREGEGE